MEDKTGKWRTEKNAGRASTILEKIGTNTQRNSTDAKKKILPFDFAAAIMIITNIRVNKEGSGRK